MIKILKFKKEHLEIMDMREHESEIITLDGSMILEKTNAFTGIIDGRIISCGGVDISDNGNGILWQIPSIYVPRVAVPYARFIRQWIDDLGLPRMETMCLDDELHNRWMKFLGFNADGAKILNDRHYIEWSKSWV